MTKSFAKISSWLSAFAVLLCTAALAGDLKVTYEIVQPCVPGVTGYSQAVIDLCDHWRGHRHGDLHLDPRTCLRGDL